MWKGEALPHNKLQHLIGHGHDDELCVKQCRRSFCGPFSLSLAPFYRPFRAEDTRTETKNGVFLNFFFEKKAFFAELQPPKRVEFYYESRKRELKTKLIYENRCDERLKN
jgi:hypothetical protein